MRQRLHQPFGVLPLGALVLALGALVAGLVLSGCGSSASDGAEVSAGDGGSTSVAPTLPEPAEGVDGLPADQIAFQEQTGGGFVPMQAAATEIPGITVYGDGRIFVVDQRTDRAYDAAPVLLATTLEPEQLTGLIAAAEATGLFDGAADLGSPMVADLPTTTVTLAAGGPPTTVSAYALGIDAVPGDGLTDEQVTARQALAALIDEARSLGADGEPWTPDRVRATMYDLSQTQREGTTEVAPWPGPAFADFPEPTPAGAVSSCLVVEGDEAAAVWDAAVDRTSAWWSATDDPSEERQIVVVPLVPGAEGCPPA